jgi:multiple antibiotic resistance protein
VPTVNIPRSVFGAALLLATAVAAGAAESVAGGQNDVVRTNLRAALGPWQVFTFLFVTLGPLKMLAPFLEVTRGASRPMRRKIAFAAFAVSTVVLFLGMFLGERTLVSWRISLPALVITGGTLLFYVAFHNLIGQYDRPARAEEPSVAPSLATALTPVAFPSIATPYGIAIVILLKAALPDDVALTIALSQIMVLNLVGMLFAGPILRVAGPLLQLVSAVLTVLQAALGIQLLILGIRAAFSMS